jgi:hypothetical protein
LTEELPQFRTRIFWQLLDENFRTKLKKLFEIIFFFSENYLKLTKIIVLIGKDLFSKTT